MLRFIFFILNAICSQSILVCKPKTSSHIVSFRFGQCFLKDRIGEIEKVGFKWLKEENVEFSTPVRSMFLTDKGKTLNVVLDDLFGKSKSLSVAYSISFFTTGNREIFRGDFNIEKKKDNSFSMYPVISRADVNKLNYVYHKYLSEIFQEYKNFSIIPDSTILYQKEFAKDDKKNLIHYFNRHRGLKEAVDSLNECLSEINHEEDIAVQINKFFDGRRKHIVGLQKKFSASKQLHKFCASIDCELSYLLMDILLLIEMVTHRYINCSIMPKLIDQNIFSAVKEVKVFDIPKTIYKIKDSEIQLRFLPKGNMDLHNEKDIWLLNNNIVYVSQDLCKICRELNWRIEVLNSKDKKKSMILEL